MEQRTIRFGRHTLDRLEAAAVRDEISLGEYVRRAVEDRLQRDAATAASEDLADTLRGVHARLDRIDRAIRRS